MSDLPFMPLWVSKYEAHTAHLTLCEDGAYLRLLRLCWRTPGGTIPADDAWVMRQMRVDAEAFASTVKPMLDEFFKVRRGRYVNDALKKFFDEANEKNQRRKNAGRKGGEAKALKTKGSVASNATSLPEQCSSKTETETETEPQTEKKDDAYASSRVKPHFIPADWKPSEELMAWAVNEFRTPNNENLTEAEIRNEADSFVDYWTGRRDTKAKRPGWDATFRARIREQAAKIIRARPRAYGTAGANASARANGASQFAPKVSQHDAFALAAIEAGVARGRSARRQDDDPALGPVIGYSGPEVVDFADARGAGARRAAGDRSDDGPSLFALPVAAVR